jgi:hypothetical protein
MIRLPHEDWKPFTVPIVLQPNDDVWWIEDDDGYLLFHGSPPDGSECYFASTRSNPCKALNAEPF